MDRVGPVVTVPFRPDGACAVRRLGTGLVSVLSSYRGHTRMDFSKGMSLSLGDGMGGKELCMSRNVVTKYTNNKFRGVYSTTSVLGNSSVKTSRFALDMCPTSAPVCVRLIGGNTITGLLRANTVIGATFYKPYFNTKSAPTGGTFSVHRSAHGFPGHRKSGMRGKRITSMTLVSTHSVTTATTGGKFLATTASVSMGCDGPGCFFSGAVCRGHMFSDGNITSPSMRVRFKPGVGS